MDSGSPFAVILVGQPSLRQRLRLGVLAALDQRIAVRYAIAGMSGADTADYIRHNAAPTVMRRRDWAGLVSGGALPRTFRIIQSCSRKAMSLSGGW